MRKYLVIFLLSFFDNRQNQREIFIRSCFYLLIVYIFSCLWSVTGVSDLESVQLVRYISITELIILSNPIIYFDIESDIRSGDVVYRLTRPAHYMGVKISENLGVYFWRFFFLLAVGWLFCFSLNGDRSFPASSYFAAFLAGLALLFCHAAIGLTAFRLQDCSPLFWLWQRCSFVLGGLILPLKFYPEFLVEVAKWTPFEALIYAPASLIFDVDAARFSGVVKGILFWGSGAVIFCIRYFNYAMTRMKVNGG